MMKKLLSSPEVIAAGITVVGTFLVGIVLSYLEGRIGLRAVAAVLAVAVLLLLVYLLYRLAGPRRTAGALVVMLIVGFLVFLAFRQGQRVGERVASSPPGTPAARGALSVSVAAISPAATATEPVRQLPPGTAVPATFPLVEVTPFETGPAPATPFLSGSGPSAGPQIQSFPAPGAGPFGIVRIGDHLLVKAGSAVYRLDTEGNILDETEHKAPCFAGAWAWDGESAWCASHSAIHRLSSVDWQETASFQTEFAGIAGFTWDGSLLWVMDGSGNLAGYDSLGQRKRRLAVAPELGMAASLAWVDGEYWVVDTFNNVRRYDSQFAFVGSSDMERCGATFPSKLAMFWDGESLWTANANDNRVYQCRPDEIK